MKTKIIIGVLVIVAAIIFGSVTFVDTNVEYGDFKTAISTHKKIQVKGEWLKDKEALFDASKGQFIFYMKDDNNDEAKVVLDGAKPNNFEIANAVVAKGRYENGYFHASDVLTKCPSKYEGSSEEVKKNL